MWPVNLDCCNYCHFSILILNISCSGIKKLYSLQHIQFALNEDTYRASFIDICHTSTYAEVQSPPSTCTLAFVSFQLSYKTYELRCWFNFSHQLSLFQVKLRCLNIAAFSVHLGVMQYPFLSSSTVDGFPVLPLRLIRTTFSIVFYVLSPRAWLSAEILSFTSVSTLTQRHAAINQDLCPRDQQNNSTSVELRHSEWLVYVDLRTDLSSWVRQL